MSYFYFFLPRLQCSLWSARSCCYKNVTETIHNTLSPLYGFDLDHCTRLSKQPLSEECRGFFLRDHCFYECSPNLGPWVTSVREKGWPH